MRRGRTFVAVCVIALSLTAPAVAAERKLNRHLSITTNSQFDADHGIVKGKGTKSDPYVISGHDLQSLQISNTDKWLRIEHNKIAGRLILDWVGDRVVVYHNAIGDLRVNQNRARTGMPSSGRIVKNRIGVVGQLRHWDGVFERNTVGSRDALGVRAVNFDGFNGARFVRNTVFGFMDARLHGHHHSSAFGEPSHMHAGSTHAMDHTDRYHEVVIADNTIRSDANYALAYLDTGHAGNDRTAASETNKDLNKPHAHHTHVQLMHNTLSGAGLLIDVFNANHPNHKRTYQGLVQIERNSISLRRDHFFGGNKQLYGIEVKNAVDLLLSIKRNNIRGHSETGKIFGFLERWDNQAGIFLRVIEKGQLNIAQNSVANRVYGVHAKFFTKDVRWDIDDLKTSGVKQAVLYENVPNKPT
jgi:hypothetical protein